MGAIVTSKRLLEPDEVHKRMARAQILLAIVCPHDIAPVSF